MNSNNAICVIPARAGSKRIKNKNIICFKGKPLIAWTIEAAIESNCFDKIIVSTDSEEIAETAKSFGADVPFLRSKKNSTDLSSATDATLEVIYTLEEQQNLHYSVVAQLMPNCPLRDAKSIQDHFSKFFSQSRQSQISVFKYGWNNPWWAHTLGADNSMIPIFEGKTDERSQDLPDLFCPTGAIWLSLVSTLKSETSFYSSNVKGEELEWIKAVDIDTKNDLAMAELMWDYLRP